MPVSNTVQIVRTRAIYYLLHIKSEQNCCLPRYASFLLLIAMFRLLLKHPSHFFHFCLKLNPTGWYARAKSHMADITGLSPKGLKSTWLIPTRLIPTWLKPTCLSLTVTSPKPLKHTGSNPRGLKPTGLKPTRLIPTDRIPTGPNPKGPTPSGLLPTGLKPTGLKPMQCRNPEV